MLDVWFGGVWAGRMVGGGEIEVDRKGRRMFGESWWFEVTGGFCVSG